jgi:hypothetical protein
VYADFMSADNQAKLTTVGNIDDEILAFTAGKDLASDHDSPDDYKTRCFMIELSTDCPGKSCLS